jgi:hypothetical protein
MFQEETILNSNLEISLNFNSKSILNLRKFLWRKLFISLRYSKLSFISIFSSKGMYFSNRSNLEMFESLNLI